MEDHEVIKLSTQAKANTFFSITKVLLMLIMPLFLPSRIPFYLALILIDYHIGMNLWQTRQTMKYGRYTDDFDTVFQAQVIANAAFSFLAVVWICRGHV